VPLPGSRRSASAGMARPGVVWFESRSRPASSEAPRRRVFELLLVVGTSAAVYPAASLIPLARKAKAKVIEINLEETPMSFIVDAALRGKSGGSPPARWANSSTLSPRVRRHWSTARLRASKPPIVQAPGVVTHRPCAACPPDRAADTAPAIRTAPLPSDRPTTRARHPATIRRLVRPAHRRRLYSRPATSCAHCRSAEPARYGAAGSAGKANACEIVKANLVGPAARTRSSRMLALPRLECPAGSTTAPVRRGGLLKPFGAVAVHAYVRRAVHESLQRIDIFPDRHVHQNVRVVVSLDRRSVPRGILQPPDEAPARIGHRVDGWNLRVEVRHQFAICRCERPGHVDLRQMPIVHL
jgi:hypothetical protein